MPLYLRRETPPVDAQMYGTGSVPVWYTGAVADLVQWIAGRVMGDNHFLEYVQPSGAWDPPSSAKLSIWTEKSGAWNNIDIGDFLVRESDGQGVYPVHRAIFLKTYKPMR